VNAATDCGREVDVLDACASEYWPDDVRAHLRHCDICSDLALVASAMHGEYEAASRGTGLPTSGQVWWRATLRTRAEAAAAAASPIKLVQALAGTCAAAIGAAFITFGWTATAEPLRGLAAALVQDAGRVGAAWASAAGTGTLVAAGVLGAALMIAPLLLVLLSEDR
jgi:hypothetical protein